MTDIVDRLRHWSHGLTYELSTGLMHEAATEIERMRSDRRWISVEERLPEEDQCVMVWTGRSVQVAWREHQPHYIVPKTIWTFGDDVDKGCPPQGISHWMPLPEPPEVK